MLRRLNETNIQLLYKRKTAVLSLESVSPSFLILSKWEWISRLAEEARVEKGRVGEDGIIVSWGDLFDFKNKYSY